MKRRDEILVGIFTTAAVIVLVLGALWLARGGLSNGYPLYATFPWGAGLKTGQPVLLVGVTVGFVDEVKLEQDGTLITSFRIRDEYQVPLGSKATVVANGIFGDMAIALTPEGPNPRSFQPGDTVPIGPPQPGLANLTARFDTIGRSVKAITDVAQLQLVDSGGIRELRQTLMATNRLVQQLSSIAALQSNEIQLTLASVRHAMSGIDSAMVDSTVRNFRQMSENVVRVTDGLDSTTARLNAVLARIESGDGTAAMLINDKGLYLDMRQLLLRLDSLTADFKQNPKRYIKLSIF
ncbi:MAG TPA: MlaD family protein [Gemmatimonadaceae bacterium]|nr:MlaD family protein [Gemmatimonadaceae bacterium]